MKRSIQLPTLRKKLPAGRHWPVAFDAFVEAAAASDPVHQGYFDIKWTNPVDFNLRPGSRQELLPFLRLGDGGFVALWLQEEDIEACPIVQIDSEGQNRVVATDFDDFLLRLSRRKTSVEDIDEADEPVALPATSMRTTALSRITPALRSRFEAWCKDMADAHVPDAESAKTLEKLRRQLHALARQMLRDKLSAVYTPRTDWWSIDFTVTRSDAGLSISYIDLGEWKPLPASYAAEPLFAELLAHVKHPKRKRFEVTVIKMGLVSVDRDRELVLGSVG